MHSTIHEFGDAIVEAARRQRPLCIRGGGTKDFLGSPPRGETLRTVDYRGIIEYEPTELVITARAGTPLHDIEAALAGNGQMLAFEPPHFGNGATLGGCIAAGLSGPRRPYAGAARDFVLGVRILDGRGNDLRFGGRVMKNVAGYDVARLMTGSLGTLGLITEISLKVLPAPASETTLRLKRTEAEAIGAMNEWAGKPLPISATAFRDGVLNVRLSGANSAVHAAAKTLEGTAVDPQEAGRFWSNIREHSDPFFTNDAPLWRLSVKPTTLPLDLPGVQLIEWGGALRWLHSRADARAIRDAAAHAGGHATLFRSEDKSAGAFQPLPPALMKLHGNLKRTFDPAGIFNPGRLYPDL